MEIATKSRWPWSKALESASRTKTSTTGRKAGDAKRRDVDSRAKFKSRDRAYILQSLATLVDHGVPLPKALETLAREKTLRRYAGVLEGLRRGVESGEGLSAVMSRYPGCYSALIVQQIRVSERAGTLPSTLERIAAQLEAAGQLRWQVARKLAYPLLLLGAGGLAVTFMLMFVVPVFQQTYADSGVPLPWITQVMIFTGEGMYSYGWIVPLSLLGTGFAWRWMRKTPATAAKLDALMLRIPLLGGWLRNIVVLEFIEALGNLLESGFTIAEALAVTSGTVSNRAIAERVEQLRKAVQQGQRFSTELERMGDLFPPVVTQLVMIAERTGTLSKAAAQIRRHLKREIERQTALLVGTIEPTLTILLAVIIGAIVLAIYLPMFDMIGAV